MPTSEPVILFTLQGGRYNCFCGSQIWIYQPLVGLYECAYCHNTVRAKGLAE